MGLDKEKASWLIKIMNISECLQMDKNKEWAKSYSKMEISIKGPSKAISSTVKEYICITLARLTKEISEMDWSMGMENMFISIKITI